MEAMIVDINAQNYAEMVIQNSHHKPVLVDFWAPWCGPCKQVMPMLEQLAQELAGQFILAKINIDENSDLADQMQIRSVPTFKLIVKGEQVGEISGAQPASAFKQMLEPYLEPDPSETLRAEAQTAFAQGQYDQAVALLGDASRANPNNYRVHLDLVKMYFETGHLDKAQDLLDKLPDEARLSPEGKPLLALLRYSEVVAEAGNLEHIQSTLAANPSDPMALYGLAGYLMLNQQPEQAMQSLLRLFMVDRDFKDGIAKKMLLELFELLQSDHPDMVNAYRRKLQNLLF